MKIENYAVGIMSGTSLDACDFVLCRYQVIKNKITKFNFVDQVQVKLPKKIFEQTWRLSEKQQALTSQQWANLNFEWGRYYGSSLAKIKQSKKWKFNLVGLHGQTVYHAGGRATLQLGEPGFCAAQTGAKTYSDFRSFDVAQGYQGAPLAPLFHGFLSQEVSYPVAFHNIGGIGNLTLANKGKVLSAFDSGPGNMPIDWGVLKYTQGKQKVDKAGHLAAKGEVDAELLARLKKHPYFRKTPPKSCGREQFGGAWLESIIKNKVTKSTLATLTEWVAWSIADSYYKHVGQIPKEIYFCGGGALNLHLLARVQSYLPEARVKTCESLGWPVFSMEGGAFAFLALARELGLRHELKQITGNPHPQLLGSLCAP